MKGLLPLLVLEFAVAFLPFQNPPWPANYSMRASTLSMNWNSSGWFNATVGGWFGVISYDWSNDKAQWAAAKPMDDEERLVTQTAMTKAASADARVFVYRNLVKALPWYTSVREKIGDPAYSGWFLKFGPPTVNGTDWHVPACDNNYDPPLCSGFYHDQEQTPGYPTGDGNCAAPACDCGSVPCGEYLWDHRNASLRKWLIDEFLLGPTGLGNSNISGFFIDDFWCSSIVNGTGACTDPVQGPTEIDAHSQVDMNLSDADIADLTNEWLTTLTDAQAAILSAGGYTWSLIPGQDNANAGPLLVGTDQKTCVKTLQTACSQDSPWINAPLLMGFHTGNATVPLPFVDQDVAAFLLMRGPHAWIGWGQWGMLWPTNQDGSGLPFPPQLTADYGEPVDATCVKVNATAFSRAFTRANVTLDCASWSADLSLIGF